MLESQIFYPHLAAEQDLNRWLEKEKQVGKKKKKIKMKDYWYFKTQSNAQRFGASVRSQDHVSSCFLSKPVKDWTFCP